MTTKTGSYDPCPCGSGKIYKNCCRVRDEDITGYNPIMTNGDDILKYTVFVEKWDLRNGPVPSFREYMGEAEVKEEVPEPGNVKIISRIKHFFGKLFN